MPMGFFNGAHRSFVLQEPDYGIGEHRGAA